VNELTHITQRKTICTMYALMYLQLTQMTEEFVTHIIYLKMLPTVYALMLLQLTLLTK